MNGFELKCVWWIYLSPRVTDSITHQNSSESLIETEDCDVYDLHECLPIQ